MMSVTGKIGNLHSGKHDHSRTWIWRWNFRQSLTHFTNLYWALWWIARIITAFLSSPFLKVICVSPSNSQSQIWAFLVTCSDEQTVGKVTLYIQLLGLSFTELCSFYFHYLRTLWLPIKKPKVSYYMDPIEENKGTSTNSYLLDLTILDYTALVSL